MCNIIILMNIETAIIYFSYGNFYKEKIFIQC